MEHRTNAHKLVLWLLAALSALCAALALAVLLPGGARTAHAAENGHAEHGTDWTALFAEGGKLTGGNYYLAADVELTTALTVSGPVTLCLNGYVLTGTGSRAVIMVESGGDFTLCDCRSESAETEHRHAYYVDGNGRYVFVTDTSDSNYTSAEENGAVTGGVVTGGMQHGIYVYGSGIFTMQGGTIAGNTAETHGGGVYINGSAKFIMSGGAITGNTASIYHNGGGVFATNSANFTMSGGTISDNTAGYGGGVYVEDGSGFTMSGGAITDNKAGVGGGAFVTGAFDMSGGYWGTNVIQGSGGITITGGYFANSPANVASDYTAVDISRDEDHYGDTGYLSGYPYAVYKTGDTPDYAVKADDITYGETILPVISGNTFGVEVSYSYSGTDGNGAQTSGGGLPTNAGEYTVTATFAAYIDGINRIYYPETEVEFTVDIAQKDIAGANVTLGTALTYNGTAQTQTIASVTVDGLTATYDVSENEQTNAGNYTLTVTGNGNFTGTANAHWSIEKRALTLDMFDVTGSYVYTGAGQEATYTFSDEGGDLTAADFGVSYSNNVNAGNGAVITFTATADGNYKGELSFNFTIEKAAYDMSGVSFTDASYTYDGSEKTLTVTGTLPDGVTVEYTANTLTDAGSVEVTASFTGDTTNYNEIDPMTATLTIERAVPAYTLPEGLTATEGDILADVALPADWSWADDALSVGEEGDKGFTAIYTPADTANYEAVSVELTVAVQAAGLPGGAIAGIVIGSAVGAMLIAYGVLALFFKKGIIRGVFFTKIYPFIK